MIRKYKRFFKTPVPVVCFTGFAILAMFNAYRISVLSAVVEKKISISSSPTVTRVPNGLAVQYPTSNGKNFSFNIHLPVFNIYIRGVSRPWKAKCVVV